MVPWAGGIFTAGMLYQRFLSLEKQVGRNADAVNSLRKELADVKEKIQVLDRDIGYLRNDVEMVKTKVF